MPDLLSSADILTLRRAWLGDQIDLHPEFGLAPVVGVAGGDTGDDSIAVTGLLGPTVYRNAAFYIKSGGGRDRYQVTANATVVAGGATISITPLLVRDAASGDVIEPEPYYRSVYNQRARRLQWSDADLQDLAQRAEQNWAAKIARADNPVEMRFHGVRLLAIRELLLPGSEFTNLLMADDPRGNAHFLLEQFAQTAKEDERQILSDARGPSTVALIR